MSDNPTTAIAAPTNQYAGGDLLFDPDRFAHAYKVARVFKNSGMVPQHLTEEACFVGVTMAEQMVIDRMGIPLDEVKSQFGGELQQIIAQQPQLGRQVATDNEVAEMDVDIIIDEVPDIINLQSEQFDLLVKMYQANPNGIPWESIVQMSTLRDKDKVLGKDDPEAAEAQQKQAQIQEALAQLEAGKTQSEIDKNNATTAKTQQEATQKQIENALILANPSATNVSI